MTERLMGIETEYAFLALRKDGSLADARQAMSRIEDLAVKHLPHLPARGQRGIFLQNASRFYRDYGGGDAHQEMTTPECPNPWDVVRYIVANEHILQGLAARLRQEDGGLGEVLYLKHNVDYSGSGNSWGTHESYLGRTPIEELPAHLVPHLVSRIVYTGAGGFNPFAPHLEFMLSPRVAHLSRVTSIDTERGRPIFNTRDESLSSDGYRRLHVICGESLCSHTSMWLRSATTALVVALTDGGTQPGRAVTLADPVKAMQTFARDPTCRVRARLCRGVNLSAIEIQRHYLQLAEAHLQADFMPPWAPQVCQHWRTVLDQLQHGAPDSVATTLDWAIKFSLFSHRLAREGLSWHQLPHLAASERVAEIRQQFFELDVRYSQLGERGVFAGLDRAGVLRHHFPGVDNFPHAMVNPPTLGRARLRGAAIRHLCERKQEGCCDWTGVWNVSEKKYLDLSTPFESTERWRDLPAPHSTAPLPAESDHFLAAIEQRFCEGCYEQAACDVQALESARVPLTPPQASRFMRLRALLQARRGHLDGLQFLDGARAPENLGEAKLLDQLYILRFMGLAPRPEIDSHFRCVLQHCGSENLALLPPRFLEHLGACRVWRGLVAEGETILEGALASIDPNSTQRARCLVELANAKRILGKHDQAIALLDQAREQQHVHRYYGDLADFTLPNLAKLMFESNPSAARSALAEAKTMQSRTRNRLGLIRSLLLDARLASHGDTLPGSTQAILALAAEVPSLASCRLFQKIIQDWGSWTRDPSMTINHDMFWGL